MPFSQKAQYIVSLRVTEEFLHKIRVTSKVLNFHFNLDTSQYVVGSKSFRPDVQKPRQMENAVRDT